MISHCKFIEYIYDKKYFEKMVLFEYKKIVLNFAFFTNLISSINLKLTNIVFLNELINIFTKTQNIKV